MSVVCTESLTVCGEPGANMLILGGREDNVAISVVPIVASVWLLCRGIDHGICALDLGQSTLLFLSSAFKLFTSFILAWVY